MEKEETKSGLKKLELRRGVTVWGSYMWSYADVGAGIYAAPGDGGSQLTSSPGDLVIRFLLPFWLWLHSPDAPVPVELPSTIW